MANDQWGKLFAHLERIENNMATKAELEKLQQTVDSHTATLDYLTKQVDDLKTESSANHRRIERLERSQATP